MEEGIYYKRGSKSDFAGVEILGDAMEIPRAIIEEIAFHENLKVQGKNERERWTCKLQGIDKPMLLNSTNRKRLAKRFWHTIVADGTECHGRLNLLTGLGCAIRLDSEPCRDPSDGEMTIGLRVSKFDPDPAPAAPAPAAKKVITEEVIEKTVKWAKEKGLTFEQVAEKFDFANETVKDAVQDAMTPEAQAPSEEKKEDDLPV
ncbi:MAG: hypothetical protein J6N54_06890 [Bacteroidales bacterium]|nr:hypothetical protein [Bacteroidales bacterium]